MSGENTKVGIYTAPVCPYCVRAKRLLAERGIEFHEIDVSADAGQRARMVETSGRRTVPQVFIGGRPVGGYDELAALDRSGQLTALLNED